MYWLLFLPVLLHQMTQKAENCNTYTGSLHNQFKTGKICIFGISFIYEYIGWCYIKKSKSKTHIDITYYARWSQKQQKAIISAITCICILQCRIYTIWVYALGSDISLIPSQQKSNSAELNVLRCSIYKIYTNN